MNLRVEVEQESDGRWLAEVPELPGTMVYGVTLADALARVQALSFRVLAERLENGEAVPELMTVSFQAAAVTAERLAQDAAGGRPDA